MEKDEIIRELEDTVMRLEAEISETRKDLKQRYDEAWRRRKAFRYPDSAKALKAYREIAPQIKEYDAQEKRRRELKAALKELGLHTNGPIKLETVQEQIKEAHQKDNEYMRKNFSLGSPAAHSRRLRDCVAPGSHLDQALDLGWVSMEMPSAYHAPQFVVNFNAFGKEAA